MALPLESENISDLVAELSEETERVIAARKVLLATDFESLNAFKPLNAIVMEEGVKYPLTITVSDLLLERQEVLDTRRNSITGSFDNSGTDLTIDWQNLKDNWLPETPRARIVHLQETESTRPVGFVDFDLSGDRNEDNVTAGEYSAVEKKPKTQSGSIKDLVKQEIPGEISLAARTVNEMVVSTRRIRAALEEKQRNPKSTEKLVWATLRPRARRA